MMVDGRYNLDAHLPLAFDVVGLVSMVAAGTFGWALVHTYHVEEKVARAPMRADRHVPLPR